MEPTRRYPFDCRDLACSIRRLRRRLWLLVVCTFVFGVLVTAGFVSIDLLIGQREVTHQRVVVAEAAEVRAEIGDQLSNTINLGHGLRSYVVANPELDDPDELAVMIGEIYEQGSNVRNIGLAPDNVIRYVHPVEGNEAAIGLRYEDLPAQYAAVEQAMETREPVVAGPVDLVQGGRGLIDRTPVFLDDGSYWGVVSLVIDIDGFMGEIRTSSTPYTDHIDWAVRAVRPDEAPLPISGDQSHFDVADANLTLNVPSGTWELAAVDTHVDPAVPWIGWAGRVLVLVLAGIVSGLLYEATRERWRATRLALHDHLTGLANRRLLEDRAGQALAAARRNQKDVGVLCLDLDGFKAVNDVHGHHAGDHVLRVVAGRLIERVRDTDTVSRTGGDEFILLVPATGAEGATVLADSLTEIVSRPIQWHDTELLVGASIGVAIHPGDGTTFDELLSAADRAMYERKAVRRSSGPDQTPPEPDEDQGRHRNGPGDGTRAGTPVLRR